LPTWRGAERRPLREGEIGMTRNMGTLDRALRASVGVVLLWLTATETIGAWGYIGLVPLLTAALGYCPAYSPFGISTCSTSKG